MGRYRFETAETGQRTTAENGQRTSSSLGRYPLHRCRKRKAQRGRVCSRRVRSCNCAGVGAARAGGYASTARTPEVKHPHRCTASCTIHKTQGVTTKYGRLLRELRKRTRIRKRRQMVHDGPRPSRVGVERRRPSGGTSPRCSQKPSRDNSDREPNAQAAKPNTAPLGVASRRQR